MKESHHHIPSIISAASLPVRLGGEEFAFVIQSTTEDEVVAFAERFRQEVEHTSFPAPQTITVSIGVGYFDCTQCDLETFFSDVDTQLYKAKANGRNRIERVSFINGTKEFS
ncbi:GGDEF domain-containing protein [Chryseomicrobium palamuruense]